MNYYNPYFFYPNTTLAAPTTNLLGSATRGSFSFSSLLNGAQRTLNFVNQAIPVVKQVSPMMKNAKTMFRVMNEFKKVEQPTSRPSSTKTSSNPEPAFSSKEPSQNEFGPTFFI